MIHYWDGSLSHSTMDSTSIKYPYVLINTWSAGTVFLRITVKSPEGKKNRFFLQIHVLFSNLMEISYSNLTTLYIVFIKLMMFAETIFCKYRIVFICTDDHVFCTHFSIIGLKLTAAVLHVSAAIQATEYPIRMSWMNELWLRQNGRHFPDNIFKSNFLNGNISISIKISLKFVLNCPITNIPALVQIMAWHRPDNKPLSEPMMVKLPIRISGLPTGTEFPYSVRILHAEYGSTNLA